MGLYYIHLILFQNGTPIQKLLMQQTFYMMWPTLGGMYTLNAGVTLYRLVKKFFSFLFWIISEVKVRAKQTLHNIVAL